MFSNQELEVKTQISWRKTKHNFSSTLILRTKALLTNLNNLRLVMTWKMKSRAQSIQSYLTNTLSAKIIHSSYFLQKKDYPKFSQMSFCYYFYSYSNFLAIHRWELDITQWEQIVLRITYTSILSMQTNCSKMWMDRMSFQLKMQINHYFSELTWSISHRKRLTCIVAVLGLENWQDGQLRL